MERVPSKWRQFPYKFWSLSPVGGSEQFTTPKSDWTVVRFIRRPFLWMYASISNLQWMIHGGLKNILSLVLWNFLESSFSCHSLKIEHPNSGTWMIWDDYATEVLQVLQGGLLDGASAHLAHNIDVLYMQLLFLWTYLVGFLHGQVLFVYCFLTGIYIYIYTIYHTFVVYAWLGHISPNSCNATLLYTRTIVP